MTTTHEVEEAAHGDLEVERATIGACLLTGRSETALGLLARGLRPEHFYYDKHRDVFAAIANLADRSAGIDQITVASELDRMGLRSEGSRGYIEELAGYVPVAGNNGAYADRVIELARWRDRLEASYDMMTAARTHDAEGWARARHRLDAATEGSRTESYSPERWGALMFDYFSATEEEANAYAVPLPFKRLTDALGGGLWPGEVLALSGATSHGKSVVADQILDFAAERGKNCHLYMTEMTAISRGMRYLARRTGVSFLKQRGRDLSQADYRRILGEVQRFEYGCSIVADWSVDDIVRDALRARYDLVVVDLLHGFHYEDERGLDRLSKAMQKLARVSTTIDGHRGTAVIPVVHTKEEGLRDGKIPRPTLASIKGASSIKQDADFVMFVWQDQSDGTPNGEGEIWIPKGRSGNPERVQVALSPSRFMFMPRASDEDASMAPASATRDPF